MRAALEARRAVVALESSVIAQGLPYPFNLQSAHACERAIRAEGAVPATIALVDGQVHIGCDEKILERLSTEKGNRKVAIRDLGSTLADGASGGTTVSATLLLAHRAGLSVFATGGIGGVHRGEDMDISADLPALGAYPVLVVCAGAKAILDLPRTLEVLETQSVPVVGLRTRELPAFYCRSAHLPLEVHVDDEVALARLFRAHRDLGLTSAVLAVQPPPERVALPEAQVEAAVHAALAQAEKKGIRGKRLTPFLLGAVAEVTQGRSRDANLALLENNARAAAKAAMAFAADNP